jgi:hypothetical protein
MSEAFEDCRDLLRSVAAQAMAMLAAIMVDEDASAMTRARAGKLILDLAYGRPVAERVICEVETCPIAQPGADQVGVHPVYLGVVVVMTLVLGLLTPPCTAGAVAGIPVTRILRQIPIMIVALVAVVLAFALVPSIVLILP